MKCVVVNARSSAQAQGLSNSGSGGTERHSGRCDRDCPVASRQTTSRSILTACHAGLITVVRKARWKIYSARGEIMKKSRNYLTDDCSPRKRVLGEINDVEMWGVDRLPLWSVPRTRDSFAGSGS